MPSPTDTPATPVTGLPAEPSKAEPSLSDRLRIIADGDLRVYARDSLMSIHPDQSELHGWADLMEEAAGALDGPAEAVTGLPAEIAAAIDTLQNLSWHCEANALEREERRARAALEAMILARLSAAEAERNQARKSYAACIADMERGGTCKRVYSDAALRRELEEAEAARDVALVESAEMFGLVRKLAVQASVAEVDRDAALARAERLEAALRLAEEQTPPDDTPRQSEWTYVAMTWADIDAMRAALDPPTQPALPGGRSEEKA